MDEGWIRMHRSIQKHWIWKDSTKLKWWIDILLTVNYDDAKVNIGYEIFDCKRGQSIMSLKNWADRWKTSKDTARNFLKLLEKDSMILHENIGKSTRITVCNYDSYQSDLHDSQTQTKRKPNANSPKQERKEREEEKEFKKEEEYISKFNFIKSLSNLGVEKKIIEDWIKVRKEKKASNTETAFRAIKREIEKSGKSANECITISVERSWSGFKAEWIDKDILKNKNNDTETTYYKPIKFDTRQ